MEVNGGRTGSHVGAVVLAGDGVHGVLPEEPLLRGQLYGFAGGLLETELVVAEGALDVENDAAGVLADGLRLVLGDSNVLLDDLHRAGGDGALLLAFEGIEDGLMHVIRDFRRGAADEFQQRILQHIHRPKAKRGRRASQLSQQRNTTTDRPSAAKPQPEELNELNGLNKLHEAKEFARAAQILTDSSTDGHGSEAI